jgi:hypothetical protein
MTPYEAFRIRAKQLLAQPASVGRDVDLLIEEVEARYPDDSDAPSLVLMALLRRHREHGCDSENGVPCPEPIGDVWSYLAGLGDLHEWRARMDELDRQKTAEQLEKNWLAAQAWAQRSLDDETRALVAAAEASLAEEKP